MRPSEWHCEQVLLCAGARSAGVTWKGQGQGGQGRESAQKPAPVTQSRRKPVASVALAGWQQLHGRRLDPLDA